MEHETFFTLMCDAAHWEFELFLLVVFDGIIGAFIWPKIKSWRVHHRSDDNKLDLLEKQVKELQYKVSVLEKKQ
jgi:hypothetical protein